MKAVLLARGLGSRMKQDGDAGAALTLTPDQAAAAAAGAKGMMPILAARAAAGRSSITC